MNDEEIDQHSPFDIDPDRLDVEWRNQAKLARAAGRREANAKSDYTHAKSVCKVVRARVYLAVRNAPASHGLREKPTVDEIDAAVELNPEYLEAVRAMNVAEHDADLAKADTTAYVDRRKALERLVDLLALNYRTEKDPKARHGRRPEAEAIDFDPRERDAD